MNASKLIKSLINIIDDYEADIVRHIRKLKDKKCFNIKQNEDEFHHFEGKIGKKNIARILGISYSNFKRNWAMPISKNKNLKFRFKSLLKLIHSTGKYFPSKVKIYADKAISHYLEEKGKKSDLRVQIALILSNYVNKPLGFSDISLLLGKNRVYLNLLSENLKKDLEFEQVNKYFNLLSSIFLLRENSFKNCNIKLKNQNSLNELKGKCYNLIVKLMLENNILNEYVIGEFEVIFYTYLTLAEFKKDNYSINEYSRKVSNNPKGILFSSKIKDGWKISLEQCITMKKLLPNNSRFSKKANNLIDNYIEYLESLRDSEYHLFWHNEDVIRFHCTVLTIRDLFIDLLMCKPLPLECFIKNYPPEWYTFSRHHIFPQNKNTINPNRIVLTITKYHPSHENQPFLIRELLKWRINNRKDIPCHYKKLKNGINRWESFLVRREYIERKGIGAFILKYLTDETGRNHFIERFYPKILANDRKNMFTFTDIEKRALCLNLERNIKKILNDWIDKYPMLIPKLPNYAKYILPKQMRIYKYIFN